MWGLRSPVPGLYCLHDLWVPASNLPSILKPTELLVTDRSLSSHSPLVLLMTQYLSNTYISFLEYTNSYNIQWNETLLSCYSAKGLDHVAEKILNYLNAESLYAAELVCKEWYRVISDGMLWRKLIEHMVRSDDLWRGLAERRGW